VQARGGYFVQVDMQGPIADNPHAGGFGEVQQPACTPKRLKHSPPLGWTMSDRTSELIVDQSTDARALACLDECVDWALGKEGAVCRAQARPRPVEVKPPAAATPVATAPRT
jgi:hypothetical protein